MSRGGAIGLPYELKKTEDAIRGTMAYIQPQVSDDVYEKMHAIIRQSIRYGGMLVTLYGAAFREGLEEGINGSESVGRKQPK